MALLWSNIPSGSALAQALADTDVATLDDDECVEFARAVQRQRAWTDRFLVDVTKRFTEHRPGPSDREHRRWSAPGSEERIAPGGDPEQTVGSFAAAEWGPAVGLSTAAARRLIADALDLTERLGAIRFLVRLGLCDLARARMVATATRDLSRETVAVVQLELLPLLGTLTYHQLRRIVDRVVARVEPAALEERSAKIRARREVFIDATYDDHAEVSATLDATDGKRLDDRLDGVARQLGIVQRALGEGAGFGPETESWQQRRARALGLLADPGSLVRLTRVVSGITHPHSERPREPLEDLVADDARSVPATTLYVHLRGDGTADLEGLGVLSLPALKELLSTSAVTVRPVIDLNRPTASSGYTPSPTVREAMVLTNESCVHPYCDRPARRCESEHTIPYPHGPTASGNLGPECSSHHRVKTHGGWRVKQPFNGVFVWRAPTGHLYVVDDNGTHPL